MSKIVDFHSHVLPGMDDGSKSIEESEQMFRMLSEQKVDIVCATPHFYREQNSIFEFLERREHSFAALAKIEYGPRLILGAEVAYFPGISDSEKLDELCLGETKELLLEMPFSIWSARQISEVVRLIVDRDFAVVLAHPERFLFDKNNRKAIERFAEMDVGLQVNAGSLLSWRSWKVGLDLLQMTERPFLGTDCHNLTDRAPEMKRARKVVQNRLGKDYLAYLDRNAADVLAPHSEDLY